MVRSREEILSIWYHDGFGVNNSAGVIVSSLGPGLNCSHCGAGRFFNASTFTCAALLLVEAGSDLVVVAAASPSEAAILVVLEDVTGAAAGVVAAAATCADVVIPEVAILAEGTAAVVGAALAVDAGVGVVSI